ncbi:MAG: carbohydrate kinase family protein [Anaerolineae bacterium]|nr:carbohydrate kinase family protein [Anaerolineae bacterium]
MPDVVALGDLNVDIIAHFDGLPSKGGDALAHSTELHCGGSAANAAIALARLGVTVGLIARVGPDSWALKALNSLQTAGVDAGGLQRDPAAMTGLMYVVVTPDGERTILGYRGANVLTDPNQIREEYVQGAKLFHLSGYALLAEPQRSAALLTLEMACRYGLTVTLDPGLSISQAALDEMHALLPVVNVLLPSLNEAQRLARMTAPEDCAHVLLGKGCQIVALKLGQDGCLVGSRDGLRRVPGLAVQTRDSTGAGDGFAAGFITGRLAGLGLHSAAILGNALGAMAAARVGASMEAIEGRDVLALLRGYRQQEADSEHTEAIEEAIDLIAARFTEEEEEKKPWWK